MNPTNPTRTMGTDVIDSLRIASLACLQFNLDKERDRMADNKTNEHGILYWMDAIVTAMMRDGDPKLPEVGEIAWGREYAVDRLSPVFRQLGLTSPHRWVTAFQGARIGYLLAGGATLAQIADVMNLAGSTAPLQVLRHLERRQPEPIAPLSGLTAQLRDGSINAWTRYVRPLLPQKGAPAWRASLSPVKRI